MNYMYDFFWQKKCGSYSRVSHYSSDAYGNRGCTLTIDHVHAFKGHNVITFVHKLTIIVVHGL